MSVNLYQTGLSGLNAAQQQLATTGHNLSNVNTPGFSRQRAEQVTTLPQTVGGNYFGTGTLVTDVSRIYSEFTYKEQLQNTTSFNYSESLNFDLDGLDSTVSYSLQAINTSITGFFDTINAIADTPNEEGLRKMSLTQAELISGDINALNASYDLATKSTNKELENIADRISDISTEIANLNKQIADVVLGDKAQPNDLLDSRDRLITELGEYTNVSTIVDSSSGVMNVLIGNGATLVSGTKANNLTMIPGDPDPLKPELAITNQFGSQTLDPEKLGGQLQAKFEFRDVHVDGARRDLDQMSMVLADALNSAQSKGLDLDGLEGKNLFSDINSVSVMQGRVLSYTDNTGTLTAEVEITDSTQLNSDEYELAWDGANYNLTNTVTGETSTLTSLGGGVFDSGLGWTFNETGGTPGVGDTFQIRPTQNGSANLNVIMQNPDGIAAATPIDISPSENNVSDGNIIISDIYDPEAARALAPLRIETLEDPVNTFTYTIYDSTNAVVQTGAYTPPQQQIDVGAGPDFQIEIQGTPSGLAPNGPEVFNIKDAFGVGNGNNATQMALIQQQTLVEGRSSIAGSLSESAAEIGSQASAYKSFASTAETLLEQSTSRHQSISGVNLDEEAANLLQFQQAYQAASQVITAANTIFDTLLRVTG